MRRRGWVWGMGVAITLALALAAAACHRVVDLTPVDALPSSGDAAIELPDAGFEGLDGLGVPGDGASSDAPPDGL